MRQFIPKGRSINDFSEDEIMYYVDLINRLSLVLTYISGQVLIFWQEGQKSVQIDIAILESFFQNIGNDDFFVPNDYFKKNWNEFFVSNCSAGKNEFFIKNNADIYPCPNLSDRSFLLGNILIDKLSSIEFNLDSIDDVCAINNNNYFDSCKSCPVKEFCWTCPASKLEIKSTNTFDGLCSKVKPFLVN